MSLDAVTRGFLDQFVSAEGLDKLSETERFERFCNHAVVSKHFGDVFNVEDVSTGEKGQPGIDGIAVIVNGDLVTEPSEVDDLCERNKYLDVTFVFVQSKTSSSFDAGDISKFADTVADFFRDVPEYWQNDSVAHYSELKERIYANAAAFENRNPDVHMYYCCLGQWKEDKHLKTALKQHVERLQDLSLFSDVRLQPVDRAALQALYRAARTAGKADFEFPNKAILPAIDGVEQAFIGVLPAKTYLKIIGETEGEIRGSLFFSNVRDYLGDVDVNREMAETLGSTHADRFAVLNNGVTIIARKLHTTGDRVFIEDFQVVNGCQTSHVLFEKRANIRDEVRVPVKLIHTTDDDLIDAVVRATNRQSPVREEQFIALTKFQHDIEDFYAAVSGEPKLYYERRAGQYARDPNVPKLRIVTVPNQIRWFAAMFLELPHTATRHYQTLLKDGSNRIFQDNHGPLPYYVSGAAFYRMESLFRTQTLPLSARKFRYLLPMVVRIRAAGPTVPAYGSKEAEEHCEAVLAVLRDDVAEAAAFREAVSICEKTEGPDVERDRARTEAFTKAVLNQLGKVVQSHG